MLAADPNQTVDVQLDAHAHMPAEARPTFTYRYLTCRQLAECRDVLKRAAAESDDAASNALLTQAIGVGLVRWKNVVAPDGATVEYQGDAAALDAAAIPREKWLLAYAVLATVTLATPSKKNLELPSVSPREPSAQSAEPTAVNA